MNKLTELEKLKTSALKCKNCKLRCGASVVFGQGNHNAKIMFIGEAPGKKEVELTIPFVGSSGKILDKMLEKIGLNRGEIYPHTKITDNKTDNKKIISNSKKNNFGVGVYITNICKCRPPENRDPLDEEIKKCWPWLEKQIAIIEPKIIVTLGRFALNAFLPNAKISQVHGQLIKIEIKKIGKIKLFPLHHPAAARINRKTRAIFEEDFQKIPKLLKSKKEQ